MRPPLQIHVTPKQRERLQRLYEQAGSPRSRTRVQLVLLSHAGYDVAAIAAITQQSDETVRRWLHRFAADGCDGLRELPHPGRPPDITLVIRTFIHECIDQHSPHEFGFVRATWTTTLLAQVVARRYRIRVTDECIRQHLGQLDIVCRRPTWTVKHLARQQPGYAQKKARLLGCCAIRPAAPMCMSKTKPN
jgi:transposase